MEVIVPILYPNKTLRDEFVSGYLLFAAQASFRVTGKVIWRCNSLLQIGGELIAVAECESTLPRLVDNKTAGYKIRGEDVVSIGSYMA
jgi:hypothetical protein